MYTLPFFYALLIVTHCHIQTQIFVLRNMENFYSEHLFRLITSTKINRLVIPWRFKVHYIWFWSMESINSHRKIPTNEGVYFFNLNSGIKMWKGERAVLFPGGENPRSYESSDLCPCAEDTHSHIHSYSGVDVHVCALRWMPLTHIEILCVLYRVSGLSLWWSVQGERLHRSALTLNSEQTVIPSTHAPFQVRLFRLLWFYKWMRTSLFNTGAESTPKSKGKVVPALN
jgi:hypothetical protein